VLEDVIFNSTKENITNILLENEYGSRIMLGAVLIDFNFPFKYRGCIYGNKPIVIRYLIQQFRQKHRPPLVLAVNNPELTENIRYMKRYGAV